MRQQDGKVKLPQCPCGRGAAHYVERAPVRSSPTIIHYLHADVSCIWMRYEVRGLRGVRTIWRRSWDQWASRGASVNG